jgi:hypothetical protein
MKKNIIIAGTARAGKSTLSSMISKQYGYQHLAMDSIIEGFEDHFPELNIDTHRDSINQISKRIAPFINAIIKSGEYDKFDYGLVIDVCQLMPEDYLKNIDTDLCEIYYLVTECQTVEERLKLLDEFDDEKEYTFYKSNERRSQICKDIIEESNSFRQECDKYGLMCLDTSYNRKEKFKEILKAIEKKE